MSRALSGLGERDRHVLQLRFIEELSQPEIAEALGISQSYVSRILRSSLAQLRDLMEGGAVEYEVPGPTEVDDPTARSGAARPG